MVGFQENGVTKRQRRQDELGVTFDSQNPGFFRCVEHPNRTRSEVNLLQSKVRIDDEGDSRVAQSFRRRLRFAGPGRCHGDGVFNVQFPLPSIVKQPEGSVTVLLDFGENDAGADRVNGSGRNKNNVALRTGCQCTMLAIEPSVMAVRNSAAERG